MNLKKTSPGLEIRSCFGGKPGNGRVISTRPSLYGPSGTRSHQSCVKENSSGVEDILSNRRSSNAFKWYTPIHTHPFSFCLLVLDTDGKRLRSQKSPLVPSKF